MRMTKAQRAEWREIQAEARERERTVEPERPALAAARCALAVAEMTPAMRAILAGDVAPFLNAESK